MVKRTPIINDFKLGELSPPLDARADMKEYSKGCRILENAMPIIEGGIARVPGSYYIRPVKNTDEGWNIHITKSGDGTGTVASDVAGIDCGASCYAFFADGSTVTLTATPSVDSVFDGWSGEGYSGVAPIAVLMNSDKVIDANFGLSGIIPAYILIDGEVIWISGYKLVGTNYICALQRRNLSNFSLLDSVDFDGNAGLIGESFYGLAVDDDFVYLCGAYRNAVGNYDDGFIQKRPKSDLSTLTWQYTYSVGASAYMQELVLDSTHVYGIGYKAANVIKVKINKDDGTADWAIATGTTQAYGVTTDGTSLYAHKHISSVRNIEKIATADGSGANTAYVEAGEKAGAFYQGEISGALLYSGGYLRDGSNYYHGIIEAITLATMAKSWIYQTAAGATTSIMVDLLRVVCDGSNLYAIGRNNSIPFIEAVDLSGNQIWTVSPYDANKRAFYCIDEDGTNIYVGYYDTTTNKGYIDVRAKSDGALVSNYPI